MLTDTIANIIIQNKVKEQEILIAFINQYSISLIIILKIPS